MRIVVAIASAAAVAGCGRIAFDERTDGGGNADARADSDVGLIQIEAESGLVTSPFRIEEDAVATGLFYVIDGNSRGLSGTGGVSFTVVIARPGTYYFWSRSHPLDSSDDSLFLGIDGGPPQDFFTGACIYGADWHWSAHRTASTCPALGAAIGVALAAGPHSLDFTSREGETMVDQFLLIDDVTYVPAD